MGESELLIQPFLILSFYGILFFVYRYFVEIKEYILENKSINCSPENSDSSTENSDSSTEGVIVNENLIESSCESSTLLSETESEDYSSDESYVQPNRYITKLRKRKRKN